MYSLYKMFNGLFAPPPWRTFRDSRDQWTEAHRDRLKNAIPRITFPSPQNVTNGKVLLLGPVQSGKSSFINSVLSVDKDRLVQKAPEGGGPHSMTLQHSQFISGNVLVCDTMGLEVGDMAGFNIEDILFLLKGNIPKNYKFDPANPITEDTPGFKPNPTNADKVHCVIFCICANDVHNVVQPEYLTKIQEMQRKINKLGVPRIMILTKIDVLCEDVRNDLSYTFKSTRVHEAVKRASELFLLPEMYIHPVQNFTHETYPEYKQSILLLLALKQALEFAQDCIEEFDTDQN